MFKCLALLIGLFAIVSPLPKTAEVFAQPAPAQAQAQEGEAAQAEAPAKVEPQPQSQPAPVAPVPNPTPGGPTLEKLGADLQTLQQQIKQASDAIARERAAAPASGAAQTNAAAAARLDPALREHCSSSLQFVFSSRSSFGGGRAMSRKQNKKKTWRVYGYLTGSGSSSAHCSSRSSYWSSP
jgi:hypothetical protein